MLDSFWLIFLGLMTDTFWSCIGGSSKEINIFLTSELLTLNCYYSTGSFFIAGDISLPSLDFGLWDLLSLGIEGGSIMSLLLICYRFFFFYNYFCISFELIWMLFSFTFRLGDGAEDVFFDYNSLDDYYWSDSFWIFSIYLAVLNFFSSLLTLLGSCGEFVS